MRRIDKAQRGVCRGDDTALRCVTDTQARVVVLQVGQTQNNIPGFNDVIPIEGRRQKTVIGIDVFTLDFSVA